MAVRLTVDFQRARQRIEKLGDYPPTTRQRALATYVGLFDLADENGVIAVPSTQIASEFAISRMSWTQFREVLEGAGLLKVERSRGGALRRMQLLPPD